MKLADVPLARIVAQGLVGDLKDPEAVVQWMTCMQAQDFPGARIAVALRTSERSLAAVDKAFNSGKIVRSWPMRGTLHLVPSRDLKWMLSLTAPGVLKTILKRREQLDMTTKQLADAESVTREVLSKTKSISREDLSALWEESGLIKRSEHRYHLLVHHAQHAIICFGPVKDGKQDVVLYDQWVKKPRKLSKDEALGEWALRYMLSHGPATQKDFAWWTKLPAAEVKQAIAAARGDLHAELIDGTEYFMDPALPDQLNAHRKAAKQTHLLPGFDEFVLGYGNRDAFLPKVHADKLVPGQNGMFLASIVNNGQIIGTWKQKGSGAKRIFEPSAWEGNVPANAAKAYAALPS